MKTYKFKGYSKTQLTRVPTFEGETLEQKVRRIVSNNEPINDGAPEIYTERKDGVLPAYNIRTDRWEIAASAMDNIERSKQAATENKGATPELDEKGKVIPLNGGTVSTDGEVKSNQ